MTTEERVMSLFDQANPVPDPGHSKPTTTASGYLDTLKRESSTMTLSTNDPDTSPRRLWMGVAAAAAAAAVLVGGLVVANRSDEDPGPADVPTTTTEPVTTDVTAPPPATTVAPETTLPATTVAPTTTVAPETTVAPSTTVAFSVPTGSPDVSEWREGIPFFQAIGDVSSLVDLERTISTPQVIAATNQTGSSDAFSVRILDVAQEELELVVGSEGARSGSYLVNLDGQDFDALAVTADGDWSLNMYDPTINITQWNGAEPFASAGPDVITYTGDQATVIFNTSRDDPFVISAYDAESGLNALVEQVGPGDVNVELPTGPVLIVVEANGNWTLDAAPGG